MVGGYREFCADRAVMDQVRPGEPLTCDECRRVIQGHTPQTPAAWTRDDLEILCGRCVRALGGQDWRPYTEQEGVDGAVDPELECPTTQIGMNQAMSKWMDKKNLTNRWEFIRTKKLRSKKGEGAVNHKPMSEEAKERIREAKRREMMALTPEARAARVAKMNAARLAKRAQARAEAPASEPEAVPIAPVAGEKPAKIKPARRKAAPPPRRAGRAPMTCSPA